MEFEINGDLVAETIEKHTYRWNNEDDLQRGVFNVLVEAGLPVEREVRLSDRDRIDMLVNGVGVEVKVARPGARSSAQRVTAQLNRYAQHVELHSLVLVTTTFRHRAVPPTVSGVPVWVVNVGGLR